LRRFITSEFNLEHFGLPHGSRIGILLPNGPELAVCLVSVISNWCAVPINPQSTVIEIEHELQGTQAQAVLIMAEEGSTFGSMALSAADNLGIGVITVSPSTLVCGLFTLTLLRPVNYRPVVLKPPSKLRQQLINLTSKGHPEISLVLHTSGTSGNKKRVPYTLDSLVIGVACIVSVWDLGPKDVNLNMMPLFHIGGIIRNVLSPILSGGSVIACSGFDPVLFWDILQHPTINYNATWYYAAPTMHHAILQQADEIASQRNQPRNRLTGTDAIRFIANAAGALLPALALNLQQTFHATILTGYGMTECMPISSPLLSYKLDPQGTSGIACGPELIIVDPEHDHQLPPGTPGHIMIRGSPCFSGYEGDTDEANEESFYTIQNQFGYFDTGDVGYLDTSGYLFITGRSKEVINRGGETISPFEIEEALIQHPFIQEACVFSVPHSHYQETIGAVIVMKPKHPRMDLSQLHEHLEKHLQRSKWPQVLVYMDGLPKNNTNKILRIKLSERMNLPEINDEMTPLSRIYQGDCPPIGTPLKAPITVEQVKVSLSDIEDYLLSLTSTVGIKGECAVIKIDFSGRLDAIVAFISPLSPEYEELVLKHCHENLPGYMCPYLVISLNEDVLKEAKSDPSKLDLLAIQRFTAKTLVLPRSPIESQVEAIWRTLLKSSTTLSVTTSFFDLGGDSLQAGQLVNALRKQMNIQLSVADLFSAPTIEKLCQKISSEKKVGEKVYSDVTQDRNEDSTPEDKFQSWEFSNQNYSNTSFWVLFVQTLPLLVFYPLRRIFIWFTIAVPWVYLMDAGYPHFNSLIIAIILSRLFGGFADPLFAVAFKWIIIGRYKPGRYPLWSSMYLRWWIVEQMILIFGKGFFRADTPIVGPELSRLYYTLMGAKIGRNVKIHEDAKLGQVDLLTIGDNVVIDVATIRGVGLEEGHMVLLPITIEDNCSIGLKSAIAPGTHLTSGTCIGPLSSSHELDSSRDEDRKYCRMSFTPPPTWMILLLGLPILAIVVAVSYVPWYFGLKLMVMDAQDHGWYVSKIHTVHHAFLWWITPQRLKYYFLIRVIKRCVVPFFRLFLVLIIKWTVIGKFTPMSGAEKATSWNRFRKRSSINDTTFLTFL
jgi:acyl-CoA synthetase (AMP-forming)/AMP-acid ligase II/acyl carrier protein/acetyltransferase-like isoleucine patch superfamily enzyme